MLAEQFVELPFFCDLFACISFLSLALEALPLVIAWYQAFSLGRLDVAV